MEEKQVIEIDLEEHLKVLPRLFHDRTTADRVEQAKFCLQIRNGHVSGVDFSAKCQSEEALQADCRILWERLPDDWKLSLNQKPSTERAAEALALYLIHLLTEFVAVRVAEDGTAFDFHLYHLDDPRIEAGLEISGILKPRAKDATGALQGRIDKKEERLKKAKLKIQGPKYIIVVEFKSPSALTSVYY